MKTTTREVVMMTAAHLPAIAEIEAELCEEPWTLKDIEREFDKHYGFGYVAIEDGEVLGYLFAERNDCELTIRNIGVTWEHQRRGIATGMLQRVLTNFRDRYSWLSRRGVPKLVANVASDDVEAIAMFAHNGFWHMSTDRVTLQGDVVLVMERYLK
jgi:ribosomal protein S18 acetylase RimI-like enzyme